MKFRDSGYGLDDLEVWEDNPITKFFLREIADLRERTSHGMRQAVKQERFAKASECEGYLVAVDDILTTLDEWRKEINDDGRGSGAEAEGDSVTSSWD